MLHRCNLKHRIYASSMLSEHTCSMKHVISFKKIYEGLLSKVTFQFSEKSVAIFNLWKKCRRDAI